MSRADYKGEWFPIGATRSIGNTSLDTEHQNSFGKSHLNLFLSLVVRSSGNPFHRTRHKLSIPISLTSTTFGNRSFADYWTSSQRQNATLLGTYVEEFCPFDTIFSTRNFLPPLHFRQIFTTQSLSFLENFRGFDTGTIDDWSMKFPPETTE